MARGQRGFTLVEIVVAFVLLAGVLVAGFEIFSAGLRRAAELDGHARALMVAQSQLAATGMEEALREGEFRGETEDRRFRWTVTVRRHEEEMGARGEPAMNAYQLYRVEAVVEWDGGDGQPRSLALATLGMGPRT